MSGDSVYFALVPSGRPSASEALLAVDLYFDGRLLVARLRLLLILLHSRRQRGSLTFKKMSKFLKLS